MTRLILLLLLTILSPALGWGAVAFDAASECIANPGTSMTCSHTTVSNTDGAIYCAISHENGSTSVDSVTAAVDGNAMDIVFTDTTPAGGRHTRVFRRLGQSAGANSVVFSYGGLNRQFAGVCVSLTGVDSGDPDDAQTLTEVTEGSTSTSTTVSSAVGDMVLDVLIAGSSITNVTVDQGNTEINQQFDGQIASGIAMSYEAGAASVTTGWAWTELVNSSHWAFNVNAASGGGGSSETFGFRMRGRQS